VLLDDSQRHDLDGLQARPYLQEFRDAINWYDSDVSQPLAQDADSNPLCRAAAGQTTGLKTT
jgi:hypothetical protein